MKPAAMKIHLKNALDGSVHPNKKKNISLSSHADRLGYVYPGFEVSVNTTAPPRRMEFHW